MVLDDMSIETKTVFFTSSRIFPPALCPALLSISCRHFPCITCCPTIPALSGVILPSYFPQPTQQLPNPETTLFCSLSVTSIQHLPTYYPRTRGIDIAQ